MQTTGSYTRVMVALLPGLALARDLLSQLLGAGANAECLLLLSGEALSGLVVDERKLSLTQLGHTGYLPLISIADARPYDGRTRDSGAQHHRANKLIDQLAMNEADTDWQYFLKQVGRGRCGLLIDMQSSSFFDATLARLVLDAAVDRFRLIEIR